MPEPGKSSCGGNALSWLTSATADIVTSVRTYSKVKFFGRTAAAGRHGIVPADASQDQQQLGGQSERSRPPTSVSSGEDKPTTRWRHISNMLRGRPDSEHEQALIRVVIVGLLTGYLLHALLTQPYPAHELLTLTQLGAAYFTVSCTIFIAILLRPKASHLRRLAMMGAISPFCRSFCTSAAVRRRPSIRSTYGSASAMVFATACATCSHPSSPRQSASCG